MSSTSARLPSRSSSPSWLLRSAPTGSSAEIKFAARLQHPHILSVHDSGETAGQLWFTMPFVDLGAQRFECQRFVPEVAMYHLIRRNPPISRASTENLTKSGPRVLVVEANDSLRDSAARTLSAEGYVVSEARHGQHAMELIERSVEPFDVVVTSVCMPVMSGYKLGRRLAESRPGLPVVYMSSAPSEALLRYGLPAGPTPFLRKPFQPQDLVREVAALVPAHR